VDPSCETKPICPHEHRGRQSAGLRQNKANFRADRKGREPARSPLPAVRAIMRNKANWPTAGWQPGTIAQNEPNLLRTGRAVAGANRAKRTQFAGAVSGPGGRLCKTNPISACQAPRGAECAKQTQFPPVGRLGPAGCAKQSQLAEGQPCETKPIPAGAAVQTKPIWRGRAMANQP
jgi:hypothetical protein